MIPIAFLDALTQLSQEHGFVIAGCGCCGSPWIARLGGSTDVYPLEGHAYVCDEDLDGLTWAKEIEDAP